MNNRNIVAQDTKVLVGADVHTNKHVVSVKVGDEREVRGPWQLSPNPAAWKSFLRKFPGCEIRVVYESGPHGYNLYDILVETEWEEKQNVRAYIVPAAEVPKKESEKQRKTDRRDSIALIRVLESGDFRPVVVPRREKREERQLLRARDQIKDTEKQLKNQIHGFLKMHGVEYPNCNAWSGDWLREMQRNVRKRDLTGNLNISIKSLLGMLKHAQKELLILNKKIGKLVSEGDCSPTAQKIERLTGIGTLTAAIIATEVADFAAFDNSEAFSSYCCLVPGEHSSGDTVRRRHVIKSGNRRLKKILVEAAWILIRYDPDMASIFYRIRAGNKDRAGVAIVAVARRLAVRVYHCVVNGAQYPKPVVLLR
jgi:transposase